MRAPAIAVYNGRIYLFGGGASRDEAGALQHRRAQIYDPTTDSWTLGQPGISGTGLFSNSSAAVVGNRIYMYQSYDYPLPRNTLWIYDPATDTYSYGTPGPVAGCNTPFVAFGSVIYALGGQPSCGSGGTTAVYRYDPSGDSWTPAGTLSRPMGTRGFGVIRGAIMLTGGTNGAASEFWRPDGK